MGVCYIPLTQGKWAVVDSTEAAMVAEHKWFADGFHRGSVNEQWYAARQVHHAGRKRKQTLHSFLTGFSLVDHRDGNGLNCVRLNMRPATKAENSFNRRKRAGTSSQYKGVAQRCPGGVWRAKICKSGKIQNLGSFSSEIEAALAYDIAAKSLFGEFARLNFP